MYLENFNTNQITNLNFWMILWKLWPTQKPTIFTDSFVSKNLSVKLKIAYSLQSQISGIELSDDALKAVKKAVEFLKGQGHELVEIDFPLNARPLIQSYYQMNAAETVAMLEPWEKSAGRQLTSQDVELLKSARHYLY